jgi:hypothetical protein
MFNRDSDRWANQDDDHRAFHDALVLLSKELDALYQQIESQSNHLQREYPEEALLSLTKYFENISARFSEYRIVKNSFYHQIIMRSGSRLEAVKRVERVAASIAVLFEQYSRRPKSYSQVKSRLQIKRLLGEIQNLKIYCSAS